MRCQRGASFLPTFADTPHMRAAAEMDGVPVQADQLGEAQAGLGREQQQGVVAAAEPRRPIWRGKDRLDLGACQEMRLRAFSTHHLCHLFLKGVLREWMPNWRLCLGRHR